ncbi:MAG: hypothetical protein ACLUUG_06825 [Lachnospiraceae bacterium]
MADTEEKYAPLKDIHLFIVAGQRFSGEVGIAEIRDKGRNLINF